MSSCARNLPTKFVRCDCAACITIDDPEMVHYYEVIDWDKVTEQHKKEIENGRANSS